MAGRKWTEEEKATRRELLKGRDMAHSKTHGLSRTREYNIWKKIGFRCNDPKNTDYRLYGGRGITRCEQWDDVTQFYRDMVTAHGRCPEKCSIERIDVNGNYEPGTCVWIPMRLQAANRRPWKHTPEGLKAISESSKRGLRWRAQ